MLANRLDAPGLARAAAAGIATTAIDHRAYPDRAAFEHAMQMELERRDIQLVCLAGFMRILTPWFIERWSGRLLNIHPSLLPSFRGLHTHERAIAEGVKLHGCSVHFVVPELDAGPIIAQAAVPVLPDDTAEALAARVLKAEHRIYPMALKLVASGAVRVEGERLVWQKAFKHEGSLLVPQP